MNFWRRWFPRKDWERNMRDELSFHVEKQTAAKKAGNLEFRVGEKGGVSVYGLGRFPVTLYYEQ